MSAPFNLNKLTLGQREKNTDGSFRDDQGMPYLDSAPTNYGTEGGKDEKKDKKIKLGTEGMSYEEKLEYYKKQKENKPKPNPKVRMGMGRSYTSLSD